MKTKWYVAAILPLACVFLSAFTTLPGGNSFEAYLDQELILNEHLWGSRKMSTITLDKNSTSTLSIHFNQCGVTGTHRSLSIRDEQNKVLKQWRFQDVDPSVKDPMPVPVQEIAKVVLGKKTGLYYESKEESTAIKLASIQWVDKTTASK